MNSSEVLLRIIEHEGLNKNSFASDINVDYKQVCDIINGDTKSITRKFAEKILTAFPHYNKVWLITGEGPMLKDIESKGVSIGHDNTGDIVSGGSMNKNKVSVVLPKSGPQKIIKPDSQIEIYLNQMEVLEQKIKHLESIVSAKDEIIKSKDETIRMKDEIIEMLKGR